MNFNYNRLTINIVNDKCRHFANRRLMKQYILKRFDLLRDKFEKSYRLAL